MNRPLLTILLLSSLLWGCKNERERQYAKYDTVNIESMSVVIADTITYDIVVKNTDPFDEWTQQCLNSFNRQDLVDILFAAVYSGNIKAYNYSDDSVMSIEEIKAIEKLDDFSRDKIGKMQFIEEWYFDEKNFIFGKRVNAIMIAYERYSSDGTIRYNPVFKVRLNN